MDAEQALYAAVLAQSGPSGAVLDGMVNCSQLAAVLPGCIFDGIVPRATVADRIAALEISLGVLRQAVGDSLVDLAKVDRLSALRSNTK